MLRWGRLLWSLFRCRGFREQMRFGAYSHGYEYGYRLLTAPHPIRFFGGPGAAILGGVWGWFGRDNRSDERLEDAVQRVLPSTVQIRVEMSGRRVEDVGKILTLFGTGFVIRSDGMILTNAHVVADSLEGGHISLVYYDGTSVWGELLALDLDSDLALLRPTLDGNEMDLTKYPPVEWYTDKALCGQSVATIGNPIGLYNSVSSGVIGGVDRSSEDARQPDSRIKYVQTDLHSNPGSSGGPLFTRDGKVIGMITTRSEVEGITFAIDLQTVRTMIAELAEQRRVFRPWFGFNGLTMSPELSMQVIDDRRRALFKSIGLGVLITKVHPHSPADEAQLRPGDIVTHVRGQRVTCLGDILIQASPQRPLLELSAIRITKSAGGSLSPSTFTCSLRTIEFDILMAKNNNIKVSR